MTIEQIIVDRVDRSFGPVPALRGVSCRFDRGTATVLEGANGAGKSTLLAILGGAIRPSAGTVDFRPIGCDRAAWRAHVGWLAHESQCYAEFTARENVELAARLHGVPAQAAWERTSRRLDAGALAGRRFGTLSRGQKQRVALARALVHRPSVLLLDEPSTGLDAGSCERLEQVIREERDAGAIVVIVSHSGALSERLGGRTLRLERGRIVGDD